MKRREQFHHIVTPLLELGGIICIFFASYFLRAITDGIPFVQLRIPKISEEQFLPFVISGVLFWGIIFASNGLYNSPTGTPLLERLRIVIKKSTLWFFLYIGFIYLTTGFLFQKEIPRLIVIYVWIFSTLYSLLLRIGLERFSEFLYKQ